jgi:hypothetical protein
MSAIVVRLQPSWVSLQLNAVSKEGFLVSKDWEEAQLD